MYYLRTKGVLSVDGWRRLLDCVQRCLLDVGATRHMPRLSADAHVEGGGSGTDHTPSSETSGDSYEDYTFHNEVRE